MAEAVGTLYEAMAGIEPLMPLAAPRVSRVTPATRAEILPAPKVVWQVALPDRAVAMKAAGDSLTVLTRDESLSTISPAGKAGPPKPLAPEAYGRKVEEMAAAPDAAARKAAETSPVTGRIVKHAVSRGQRVAVGYWGGLVRIVSPDGKAQMAHQFQHDIAGLAWFGDRLVVGLSDGRVLGLAVR
jgi:hypothetical protein